MAKRWLISTECCFIKVALLACLVLALAPFCQAQPASPDAWSQPRGNLQNTALGPGGAAPLLAWKIPLTDDTPSGTVVSEVVTTPVVGSDGTVYFNDTAGYVWSVNGTTGAVKWKFFVRDSGGEENFSSPVIGPDGTIYAAQVNLYALDPATGAIKWQYDDVYGTWASPVVTPNGAIYIAGFKIGTPMPIVAISASTGQELWQTTITGYFEQELGICANGVILASAGSDWPGELYAIDPTTGHTIWSKETSWISTPSIGSDGTAYSSWFGLCALNPTDGAVKWQLPNVIEIGYGVEVFGNGPAIGPDGELYTSVYKTPYTEPYLLDAIDPQDGTVKWSANIDTAGVPVVAQNGTIYVQENVNDGGDFFLDAISPTNGTVLWKFPVPNAIQDDIAIGPNGSLYFGGGNSHDSYFYALQSRSILNFYPSASSVTGGSVARGVVQLSMPAGPSGFYVALQSSNQAVAVPASVTLASGSTGISFPMTTSVVSSSESVVLQASANGVVKQFTLTVNPYPITRFYASPGSVFGGQGSHGVVQLAGKAGTGGDVISLTSGSSVVSVPATVTVPAGTTGVSFAIGTSAVTADQTVTLKAVLGPSTEVTSVTVEGVALSDFYFSPSSVVGGAGTRGVVRLNGEAGPDGAVVKLVSANGSVQVPASVTIPAGLTAVSFAITTSKVTASTSVNVTATYLGGSMTAVVGLTP